MWKVNRSVMLSLLRRRFRFRQAKQLLDHRLVDPLAVFADLARPPRCGQPLREIAPIQLVRPCPDESKRRVAHPLSLRIRQVVVSMSYGIVNGRTLPARCCLLSTNAVSD